MTYNKMVLIRSYELIQNFIDSNTIPGNDGIFKEHEKVENIIQHKEDLDEEEQRIVLRYQETACLIRDLMDKFNRQDILLANIHNWGSGNDDGEGSNFRNFEFECHIALRYLEENCSVSILTGTGEPEFCIDNKFVIECKRPTKLKGIFFNTLKAQTQINNYGLPGIVIFNLDDLENFNISEETVEKAEEIINSISRIAEYGLGEIGTHLAGIVFEQVSDNPKHANGGSYLFAKNNRVNDEEIFKKVSQALLGNESLHFNDCEVDINSRFKGEYDKKNKLLMEEFYSTNIPMYLKS